MPSAQGAEPLLASRIVEDAPRYCYGENASNRYAHGGWAFLTIGRDEDAWELLGPLRRSAATFLQLNHFPGSTASAFILIYAALRRGDERAAKLGIQLARLRRLTLPEAEDLALLEACLRSAA